MRNFSSSCACCRLISGQLEAVAGEGGSID